MACPEIAQMRSQVCNRLEGTLNTWQYNLQAKWGDPQVYEAEREERLRQDARIVYDLNRRNTALLSDAYAKQAEKQRSNHSERMEDLKRRGYRSGGKRPQSAVGPPTHTAPLASPHRSAPAESSVRPLE